MSEDHDPEEQNNQTEHAIFELKAGGICVNCKDEINGEITLDRRATIRSSKGFMIFEDGITCDACLGVPSPHPVDLRMFESPAARSKRIQGLFESLDTMEIPEWQFDRMMNRLENMVEEDEF